MLWSGPGSERDRSQVPFDDLGIVDGETKREPGVPLAVRATDYRREAAREVAVAKVQAARTAVLPQGNGCLQLIFDLIRDVRNRKDTIIWPS